MIAWKINCTNVYTLYYYYCISTRSKSIKAINFFVCCCCLIELNSNFPTDELHEIHFKHDKKFIICSGCGLSVVIVPDSLQKGLWIGSILCFLTSSLWLIEGQLDCSAHSVLCSLLWCMRDMHALTSISVVSAPKGGQSLCSAAGPANTNSEVLWLYQTSWLCVCEFCGLQRSSAPHLKMSFNCKLLGV